jgi:hypothetical protein
MPKEFYQHIKQLRIYGYFSIAVFIFIGCLLSLALVAFRRYSLISICFLVISVALIIAWYCVKRMSFDVPNLYSVLIETKKPVSRLVECGADNVCEQAYALFATDGHMHARVLTLTLEDFDSKKIASNKRKANKLINQKYHLDSNISISDSYTHFRINLLLVNHDSAALHAWVQKNPEQLLRRAEPIVQAAIVLDQEILLFPSLKEKVTPANVNVYETASKLLVDLFLAM